MNRPGNRLDRLFTEGQSEILSVYFTAGYPALNDTLGIATLLAAAGADVIEIGIPYSDPVADGPTIQGSNQKALRNGMSLKTLLSQLKPLREKLDIPVILMGYLNPVLQYGVEQFCRDCQSRGVDGLIIPDLPLSEYLTDYQKVFHQHNLHHIFLVTPQTTEDRIKMIDSHSTSFIYAVSDSSVTGQTRDLTAAQRDYFGKLNSMNLDHPFLIGFGIYDARTFQEACRYGKGAIIGSAFIKALSNKTKDLSKAVHEFINPLKSHDNTTAT